MAESIKDPFSIQQVTGLPYGVSRRRRLSEIIADPTFSEGDAGPSIEDDEAAYQRFLQAGEAARRREEGLATDQVLQNAQSRGLARSGIALKDIVSQVLGPSFERANSMATNFGLEQARRRSDLLEAERARRGGLNSQRLGGRISSILQQDQGDIGADSQVLGGLQDFQARKLGGAYDFSAAREGREFESRQNAADRKAARRNAVIGGVSGVVGSTIGALCFHPDTLVLLPDVGHRRISDIALGDKTMGGEVLSIRWARASDMYSYDGILVTGKHAVFEDGAWKRVEDSVGGSYIPGEFEIISLITSDHRVFAVGKASKVKFADEIEVDGGDQMTNEQALAALNAQEAAHAGI